MNTVNPVQFYPRNPGLNLDPGSTNSSRIAPLMILKSVKILVHCKPFELGLGTKSYLTHLSAFKARNCKEDFNQILSFLVTNVT
jgi:hypothetical protein